MDAQKSISWTAWRFPEKLIMLEEIIDKKYNQSTTRRSKSEVKGNYKNVFLYNNWSKYKYMVNIGRTVVSSSKYRTRL